MPQQWSIRRFEREFGLALQTLPAVDTSAKRSRFWWDADDSQHAYDTVDAGTVLHDCVAAHISQIGTEATHLILLKFAVTGATAVVPSTDASLPPKIFADLISAFDLGHAFARALRALQGDAALPASKIGELAGGFALQFSSLGDENKAAKQRKSTAVALLSAFQASASVACAAALRPLSLPTSSALVLAEEAMQTALQIMLHDNLQPMDECVTGLGVFAAALLREQQMLTNSVAHCVRKAAFRLRNHLSGAGNNKFPNAQAVWTSVLEMLAVSDDLPSEPESDEPLPSLCLLDDDRLAFQLATAHLAADCLCHWPTASAHLTPQSQTLQSMGRRSAFVRVDLYSDPKARKAQEALLATLPPGKQVEMLLTSAEATNMTMFSERIIDCFKEDAEACAAIVMREDAEGDSAWPLPVISQVLAALVHSTLAWSHIMHRLPRDASLFDALWSLLCRLDNPAGAAIFWPWACRTLIVTQIDSSSLGSARRNSFAVHVANRIARTLQADAAACRAAVALDDAIGDRKGDFSAAVQSGSSARLRALSEEPISSLCFALADFLGSGMGHTDREHALFEMAGAAMASWLRVAMEVLMLDHLQMGGALLTELSTLSIAADSMCCYARAHLVSSGVIAQGQQDVYEMLLVASLRTEHSGREVGNSMARLSPTSCASISILPVLHRAALEMPKNVLARLVLVILPGMLDRCRIKLPAGDVMCSQLVCNAGPFGDVVKDCRLLRSVHVFLVCTAAGLRGGAGMAYLRAATEVVRAVVDWPHLLESAGYKNHKVTGRLCQLFAMMLLSIIRDDVLVSSQTMVGACLLLRRLRTIANSDCDADCLEQLGSCIKSLEGVIA